MKKYLRYIFITVTVLIFTGCSSSIYDYSQNNDYWGVVEASKVESVNSKDSNGYTALHRASDNGNLKIVKFLIGKGANIEAKTVYGDTSLVRAAYKGHLPVVKYLVSKGADINAESNSGVTPLITAVGYGRLNIVKFLVESGADINRVSKNGNTPLKNAKKYKQTKIIAYFDSTIKEKEQQAKQKQKEEAQKKALEEKKQREQEQIAKVNGFIKINDFDGLKKYTDQNPNAVYFIQDPTIRLMLTGPKGLKVGDIRKLVKKGRSERIILSLIKRVKTPYKEFNLEEIDILVEMGLSDNIIAGMIDVTTQLLKDAQRKKEQEYYLAEQKRIAEQNKTQVVKERVIERQVVNQNQNSGGNELMNAVGKEVGKEIGKQLLDSLF